MLNELKSNKKRTWILLGVTSLIVVSLAGIVWSDLSDIEATEEATNGVKRSIMDADRRISQIPAIESRVLRERLVVDQYAKILPSDDQINHFVDTITEYANESGIEIHQLDDQSARTLSRKKSREPFVKIIYKLVAKGTVSEFLDFLHLFETYDRFVRVTGLDIKTEAALSEDAANQRHALDLQLETYVYNRKGASADKVNIVNAEAKTAHIRKTEDLGEALTLTRFDFKPNPQRRDPFIDPRHTAGSAASVPSRAAKEVTARFTELTSELERISDAIGDGNSARLDLVQRIEFTRRVRTELQKLSSEVATAEKSNVFAETALEGRFQTEVVEPLRRLVASHGSGEADALMEQELRAEVARLTKLFDRGDYESVLAATGTLLGSESKLVKADKNQSSMKKLRNLRERATNRSEFAKKPLKLGGMVFQPSNPDRAIIIVNDRAYSQGESIDDETTVRTIRPGLVTFVYRTEEINRRVD